MRALDAAGLRRLRGRTVSYIAQSAAASFNPSRCLIDQVVEPAVLHGTLTRAQAEAKAVALFTELALPDPQTIGRRYPHQVSGGQLQRLMAAMALIAPVSTDFIDCSKRMTTPRRWRDNSSVLLDGTLPGAAGFPPQGCCAARLWRGCHPLVTCPRPKAQGRGSGQMVTTTLPCTLRSARCWMASPPRASGKCAETRGRILPLA